MMFKDNLILKYAIIMFCLIAMFISNDFNKGLSLSFAIITIIVSIVFIVEEIKKVK